MSIRRRVIILQFKSTGLLVGIFGLITIPGLFGAHLLDISSNFWRAVTGASIAVVAAIVGTGMAKTYYEFELDKLERLHNENQRTIGEEK